MSARCVVMSINDILIDEFAAELDVLKVRLTYLVKLISRMIFLAFADFLLFFPLSVFVYLEFDSKQ